VKNSYHMTSQQFRAAGKQLIDWIADYYERIETYPVLAQVAPGDVRASLPPAPPASGQEFDSMFRDFESEVLPGVTHWQSPNFFAYFPANVSEPSILGE
jgi:aromatic-L-amino-acid decarboxylase